MSESKEYKDAVLQMYAALLAYRKLDDEHGNCDDCMESGMSAEACEYCMPFADDARCQLEPAIAAFEQAVAEYDPQAEVSRLRAENARIRAALEPFARWANQMDSPPNWVPDGCPIIASPGDISDFCVGMLRRARAALAGKEQENASSQT